MQQIALSVHIPTLGCNNGNMLRWAFSQLPPKPCSGRWYVTTCPEGYTFRFIADAK